jgi:hypothetical protein
MEDGPTSAIRECDSECEPISRIELKHGLQDIMNPQQIQFLDKTRVIAALILNFRGFHGQLVKGLNEMISKNNQGNFSDFEIKLDEIQSFIKKLQTHFFEQRRVLPIDKLNLETAFVNAEACLTLAISQNAIMKDHEIFCAIKKAMDEIWKVYLAPIIVD